MSAAILTLVTLPALGLPIYIGRTRMGPNIVERMAMWPCALVKSHQYMETIYIGI